MHWINEDTQPGPPRWSDDSTEVWIHRVCVQNCSVNPTLHVGGNPENKKRVDDNHYLELVWFKWGQDQSWHDHLILGSQDQPADESVADTAWGGTGRPYMPAWWLLPTLLGYLSKKAGTPKAGKSPPYPERHTTYRGQEFRQHGWRAVALSSQKRSWKDTVVTHKQSLKQLLETLPTIFGQ